MQVQSLKFRKDIISILPVKEEPYYIKDTDTPNLRLRIYPSGVKTFLVCRKVKRRFQRIKIGRFGDLTIDQARQEAARINALIGLGRDPHEEKQINRTEPTFKEMFLLYYQEHLLPHTKRPEANRREFEYRVFPRFGNMPLSDITPEKLRKFHAEVGKERAKATANRVMGLISAVFNFAIKAPYYKGTNPCLAVKRFRTKSRDRFLQPHELDLFLKAASREEQLFADFFQILLYTGARKSNVLAMKWSGIEFPFKRWRISDDEAKNGEINIVMLTEPALKILERRYKENRESPNPSKFVFPGTGECGHLHDPKKAFKRIRKRMGIFDFTIHDLRRTLGSYMAITSASLPVIGSALNHKSHVSTEIYARLSQEPVLEAVNKAVKMIKGGGKISQFKENWKMCEPVLGTIQFSDLLT